MIATILVLLHNCNRKVNFATLLLPRAVEGSVKSFSDKEVEVLSGSTLWIVPRKYVKQSDLVADQPLSVEMTKDDFAKLKHTESKKK